MLQQNKICSFKAYYKHKTFVQNSRYSLGSVTSIKIQITFPYTIHRGDDFTPRLKTHNAVFSTPNLTQVKFEGTLHRFRSIARLRV